MDTNITRPEGAVSLRTAPHTPRLAQPRLTNLDSLRTMMITVLS